MPGTYARTDWTQQRDFLQVLLVSVCELTHKLLPGMLARGYGRIVNVASLAGLVPGMPSHTLYGAAKSFVVRFSQSLHLETPGHGGSRSPPLCPGLTWTEFHDANGTRTQLGRIPGFLWQDAQIVARAGFQGVEANRPVVVTGWPNRLVAVLVRLLPDPLLMAVGEQAAKRVRST